MNPLLEVDRRPASVLAQAKAGSILRASIYSNLARSVAEPSSIIENGWKPAIDRL